MAWDVKASENGVVKIVSAFVSYSTDILSASRDVIKDFDFSAFNNAGETGFSIVQYCEWPDDPRDSLESSDEICTQSVVPYQIHAIKFSNYT